jgi:hypothetical protein
MPPNIKPGVDAAAEIKNLFVQGTGLETDPATLQTLQNDCRVLLVLIQQCLDDISANDPNQSAPVDHNWLKDTLEFDLTGYSQQDRQDYAAVLKLAFQQELDDSTFDGYKIVKFDLVDDGTGTNTYVPVAYLRPMYQPGPVGGTGGTGTPTYPPR